MMSFHTHQTQWQDTLPLWNPKNHKGPEESVQAFWKPWIAKNRCSVSTNIYCKKCRYFYLSINSSSNTLLSWNVVQSQLRKLEVVQHEHPATLHWQPIKCKHLKSAAWGSVFPSAHGAWLRSPFKGISVPKCTWEGISVLCVEGKIYT